MQQVVDVIQQIARSDARSRPFVSGSGPPPFTAITMSLPMRVKVLAIWPHRFILRAFRYSNALPIV